MRLAHLPLSLTSFGTPWRVKLHRHMALTPQLTRLTNNQRLGLAIGQARVKWRDNWCVYTPFVSWFGTGLIKGGWQVEGTSLSHTPARLWAVQKEGHEAPGAVHLFVA